MAQTPHPPVIHKPRGLALLVKRHQPHVRMPRGQYQKPAVPVAGIELDTEQRGDHLALERVPAARLAVRPQPQVLL